MGVCWCSAVHKVRSQTGRGVVTQRSIDLHDFACLSDAKTSGFLTNSTENGLRTNKNVRQRILVLWAWETCGIHGDSGTDRPECQSKEGGGLEGEGVEKLGKRNVLAEPLWEALLKQA